MSHYLRNLLSGLPAIAGEDDRRIGFLGISPIYHIEEQTREYYAVSDPPNMHVRATRYAI